MSTKGLVNLHSREISTVAIALTKAGATEEERRIFFHPRLCEPRIDAWVKAIRAGKIVIPKCDDKDEDITLLMPCTD